MCSSSKEGGEEMTEKDVSSRVLSKIFGGTLATLPADPSADPVVFAGGEGWNSYYAAGTQQWLLYNIQTIDLTGYTLQDMTLFPQGILFQDMDTLPIGTNMGSAVPVKRVSLVSTTPVTENDLSDFNLAAWHTPGSLQSTFNLTNILAGRMRTYLQLDTFAGLQPVGVTTWGAGDSTAGQKLWLVEAYLLPAIASLTIGLPDSAVLLPSLIAEEPELEYLMRLSRSLEPVY